MALDLEARVQDEDDEIAAPEEATSDSDSGPGEKAVALLLRAGDVDEDAVAAVIEEYPAEKEAILSCCQQNAGNAFVSDVIVTLEELASEASSPAESAASVPDESEKRKEPAAQTEKAAPEQIADEAKESARARE